MMIGLPGPDLDAATAERVRSIGPGGTILFARNLETPERTRRLLLELRGLMPAPALFALDQEGGRVSRLEPFVGATPSAAALARAGEAAVREFGRATAQTLRALGFNLDFAPVVDLCDENATNGIGDRSFGTAVDSVSRFAGAFLEALQDTGVAGCIKHFPGLGSTDVDSHQTLPASARSRAELEASEIVPFARLASRAASVMVGHGHYPGLDPTVDLPATLSYPIVSELLRGRLGFRGLIVSDDLEMGAVAPLDRDGDAAVRAMEAGCDLLLYCRRIELAEAAVAAMAARAETDPPFGLRLQAAAQAVERLAERVEHPVATDTAWEPARRGLIQASAPGLRPTHRRSGC